MTRRTSRSFQASLIFAATVVGPGWAVRAQTPIRVATWNVETVGTRGTSQYNAALLTLKRINADVVGIEEIDFGTDTAAFQNLAADAGYPFMLNPASNPFGTLHNGFLSRYPFKSSIIHTSAELSGDADANDITRLILEIVVSVDQGARDLTLIVVHLKSGTTDADEFRRAVEGYRTHQTVLDLDERLDAYVVMGDMNEEIFSVPRSPNPLTRPPTGLPISFSLGLDIAMIMLNPGLQNNPFYYFQLNPGPAMTALNAKQKDGGSGTREASGRRLDYLFVSPALAALGPASEVYDSKDEGLPGGLPKSGNPPPTGTSALAADHFMVFADLKVPSAGGPFGDFDGDLDVDLEDAALFFACYTGSGGQATNPCKEADSDGDKDVDLVDYRGFYLNLTGP